VYVIKDSLIGVKLPDDAPGGVSRKHDEKPHTAMLKADVQKEYMALKQAHKKKDEKEFKRLFEDALKVIWFNEATKDFVRRGFLTKKGPRYFGRGAVKEMGVTLDTATGYTRLEAIPRHTNTHSDYATHGRIMEFMQSAERKKIEKLIRRKHNDPEESIYVVTNGLIVWHGWNLTFYDSREDFFTVLVENNKEVVKQIGFVGDVSNMHIYDNPRPVTVGEKVLLAVAYERDVPYHPTSPLKTFD
jgi:hypothetical protein